MATNNKFEINGLIDTSEFVLDNINKLATSSGCFVTWDPAIGKWSVIVNEAGVSVKSFNDSNIIGNITVGGSGINELYNSVVIEFPHKDMRDTIDYITLSIPSASRYPQELDNQLLIQLNTINDPVQAQIIASQELKQNRVDKVIQFSSDYTANGLKAGDIIDVTASMYDFTSKKFRIISIEEADTDDGAIIFSISALEYDADVYVYDDLEYDYKTKRTGIPSKILNEEMAVEDDISIGKQIGRLLAANAVLGIANSLFDTIVNPLSGAINMKFADDDKQEILNKLSKPGLNISPTSSGIAGATSVCAGDDVVLSFTFDCGDCLYNGTEFGYDYEITGISDTDVSVPLTGSSTVSSSGGSLTIPTNSSAAGKTMAVTIDGTTTNITVADCTVDPLPGTPGGEALPTTCEYESVPIVWCGIYNGDTGILEGISVKATAMLPKTSGGATVTVPKTCSVDGSGNIVIDTTVDVASSSSLGGIPFNVITSFSGSSNGLITGTTTTVYGY